MSMLMVEINRLTVNIKRLEDQRAKIRESVAAKFGSFHIWHHMSATRRQDIFSLKAVSNLSVIRNKICYLKAKKKKMQKDYDRLLSIHESICDFMHLKTFRKMPYHPRKKLTTGDALIAKYVFCKFVLENTNIKGTWVSKFLGDREVDTCRRYRQKFTRSFQEHPERRQLYIKIRERILEVK